MISALVINVKSATERREFQQRQLTKLGIPFEILEATMLSVEQAHEYSRGMKNWERPIRHTEVAAMDSHKRAWQQVIDLNESLLILEDDAILSPQTAAALRGLNTILIDKKVDCLTLETRARRKWLGKKPLARLSISPKEKVEIHPLIQDRSGLAAYVLTPNGAIKLMSHNHNQLGLADALMWGTYELKTAQTVPALATQADRMAHFGRVPPIDPGSIIGAGELWDKPTLGFRIRRVKGQVRQALRIVRFAFRAQRVLVPLIDF